MRADCDRSWQIDALREGRLGPRDAESFERHRRLCAACAACIARDEKLRSLGRALGSGGPSELALRRLRARVLRDAATGHTPSRTRAWLPVVAAAVAAALLALWHPSAHRGALPALAAAPVGSVPATRAAPLDPLAATVTGSSDARWTQARAEQVERVRLDEGTLAVRVRPQRAGERFLVELPDGEIEVRGTTFQVTVRGGATARVHVDEGKVELRLNGQVARDMTSSDTWAASSVASPAPPLRLPAPTMGSSSVAASSVARTATAGGLPSEETTRYSDAVQALREGKFGDAAEAFHAFASANPSASQAEDASFLEAVALARAGRVDAAGLAAMHHLESFPASFHRKDAAILVARAAAARNECDQARAVLAPWLGQPADADALRALRGCRPAP
jgi:TolA-binding protein